MGSPRGRPTFVEVKRFTEAKLATKEKSRVCLDEEAFALAKDVRLE